MEKHLGPAEFVFAPSFNKENILVPICAIVLTTFFLLAAEDSNKILLLAVGSYILFFYLLFKDVLNFRKLKFYISESIVIAEDILHLSSTNIRLCNVRDVRVTYNETFVVIHQRYNLALLLDGDREIAFDSFKSKIEADERAEAIRSLIFKRKI